MGTTSTSITIDGTKPGRVFDGIGAISGGGGNLVQLPAYPAQQQSDILDVLFKPGAGAALQILKVEIGGDANSSAGAEPSFEHSRGVINPNGGYEWWLIQQAKARNPAIKIYALAWSAPGWAGSGGSLYSANMITYLVDYLTLAQSKGITIDYLGGWNEHPASSSLSYNASWIESLRTALDNAGFGTTQLVMTDMPPWANTTGGSYNTSIGWQIGSSTDSTLLSSVAILGCHDVCNYPTDGKQCWSTSQARASGKPLWHSEVGAMPGADGSPFIRSIIRGYIDARMTGHLQWPILTSQPWGLPYSDRGMIWCAQPRTGYYIVKPMAATFAMVTQFTEPGWLHIDSACGYLGGNRANGSYMSLQAPDHSAWSLVVETTGQSYTQNITVTVKGGLPGGTVHVWRTSPANASWWDWMSQRSDIKLSSSGSFTFGALAGYIYTFTSTAGHGFYRPRIPANSNTWSLPYSDNWIRTSAAAGTMPPMLAPQDGSFEFMPAGDGSGQYVLQQTTPAEPVMWIRPSNTRFPYAVIGGNGFPANYQVSASVLFKTRAGSADLISRFGNGGQGSYINNFRGYIFDVGSNGDWWLTKNTINVGNIVLGHGNVAAPALNTWTAIGLWVKGTEVAAWIGSKWVITHYDNDSKYAFGTAGIGTDAFRKSWSPVQFKNFSITAVS